MPHLTKMTQDDWSKSWEKHLEQYLNNPPRTGIFIKNYFHDIQSCLEIACGSSRDSIYLAKNNINTTATDYEGRVIKDLKRRFNLNNLYYQQANAFLLPFKDNSFDLVFHNGLFVLFNDNYDIYKLLLEQERVSRRYILILVHNKLNKNLVTRFKEQSSTDKIYDIRFFEADEIITLIRMSGIKAAAIKVLKFGGFSDILYSKKLKKCIPNLFYPLRYFIIPKFYQVQTWGQTERIACVIDLKK